MAHPSDKGQVLVTGGGGFLGREICLRLVQSGCRVYSLGRSPRPDLSASGVRHIRGDVRDAACVDQAVQGCDTVFHVAAKAGVWGPRAEYFATNVEGTRHVVQACVRHGIRRLVYTSTPSVVFNGESFEGADESLPYGNSWLCAYAESKAEAEKIALGANSANLRVCALRPHLIWGPGDPHILPRIMQRAARGRLLRIGDGSNRVDITHVANAAQAHVCARDALAQGAAAGKAYFISQGEPVVLWDWIGHLLEQVGLQAPGRSISLKQAYRLGTALECLFRSFRLPGEPPMTRFVAVEMAKSHWFDISAARRDLGYDPAVSTAEGLHGVIQEWQERRRV